MSQKRKISVLWVTPLVLDTELHRSARLQIVEQFISAGDRIALIALRSKKRPIYRRFKVLAVPLRYVPVIQPIMFAVVLAFLLPLYSLLWKTDYVVFTQPDVSVLGSIPVVLLSKLKKAKCILDIRSTPVEISGIRGDLQCFFFSISVLVAKTLFDGMTIITQKMKNQVCMRYKIDSRFVGVWTSGVSVNLNDPKRYFKEKMELKDKLNLTGKFVVFYHGTFSPSRGLIELVKAVAILKASHPDIVVFLLGGGPSLRQLEDIIEKEGLRDNVIIHQPVEYLEVPKFIAMSDVTISPLPDHPYWRFQCPLKLLEYMAMEKTVILTDIPAHREVVGRADCGIYLRTTDPDEIANALKYTYSNRTKLDDWGKTGRKIVEEKYTWEKVAADLRAYLLSMQVKN
jgi:glycosyltransferase involved in cell wall biosynthesis